MDHALFVFYQFRIVSCVVSYFFYCSSHVKDIKLQLKRLIYIYTQL